MYAFKLHIYLKANVIKYSALETIRPFIVLYIRRNGNMNRLKDNIK